MFVTKKNYVHKCQRSHLNEFIVKTKKGQFKIKRLQTIYNMK